MTGEPNTPARRPSGRKARVGVMLAMIGVAITSILIVAVFNFFAARNLLNGSVEAQLANIAESRGAHIEDGVEFVDNLVTTLAADRGLVQALRDLTMGFTDTGETLTIAQVDDLRTAYAQAIEDVVPSEVQAPEVDALFPASDRARYLQYHYLLENPFEDRSELVDADDGSPYSAAHAAHHTTLRRLTEAARTGDLLLIDSETASVVYSTDKRIDFATNLKSGPHRDSALAKAVLDRLRTAAANEAVIVDFDRYDPAGRAATLFVAAAVRDGGPVIGAVALEIPNVLLNEITTAEQDWEGTGLGETGEVYVVGSDGLMRSDSRLWLENPEAYLEAIAGKGFGEDVANPIIGYQTTVLAQPVETEPVAATLLGEAFEAVTSNYLGQATLSTARPLQVGDLQWVVVADVTTAEAHAQLRRYARNLLILAAILVPLVAGIAMVSSRWLLKPVTPISDAADRVSAGELEVELPVYGRGEFGDVAAKLNAVVAALREQEAGLRSTEAEVDELLTAVMPSQLADQFKRGDRDLARAVQDATVISVDVMEPGVADPLEQEALADNTVAIAAGITELARRHGAELLRSSATEHVYATGLTSDDLSERQHAEQAMAFASEAREWIRQIVESTGLGFEFRGGLAAGSVLAAVVGTERIAFAVWGTPRRAATELAAVALADQILVDPTVAGRIGHDWVVEPMVGLIDLKGDRLEGWRVVARRPAEAPSGGTQGDTLQS